MSEIWPLDVRNELTGSAKDAIRPFKCILLMPFESRFAQVATIIHDVVLELVTKKFGMDLPEVKRLDWITSSQAIQQEIWQEIFEADLVFCDITGYNPNVMFECGVCAAWKKTMQVVFIRDHFFKQESIFDIAPFRYTEYELTADGVQKFAEKIVKHTEIALIGFPDFQGSKPEIILPYVTEFRENRDDTRIYTPPFAHRRISNEALEFGSIVNFAHSWASIGKKEFLNFELEFLARFSNPKPDADAWIGVGLRSQNFFANYSHLLYLRRDGRIVITEPNEESEPYYANIDVRPETPVNLTEYHSFRISFDESVLNVQVDDFQKTFPVGFMKKVFGPGLIRFQAYKSWMAIKQVRLKEIKSSHE
jgi:hypothetical protein